jgi:NAD(P)H-dependent FMN reductase
MYNLKIITSTTRPGRKGPAVASWIAEKAKEYSQFEVEILDLAEIDLPLMNEPNHPRLKKYQHDHTKQWSEAIESADAFIFVVAEYNHGFTAPLKNAIDYLSEEWAFKPIGIVSYGGVAGGTRAVHMLKEIVTSLNMVPIREGVIIPFLQKYINDQADFEPNEIIDRSADTMLQELTRWSEALESLREEQVA